MAWGQPGVSKRQLLENASTAWGSNGVPQTQNLQQVGILKQLIMETTGTPTFTPGTGAITADVLGPYNAYSLISLIPNMQSPLVQTTGYGLALVNLAKSVERESPSLDTTLVSVPNVIAATDVFAARQTTGTLPWRFALPVPVSQRLAAVGDIGMFPLGVPQVALQFQFTQSSSTASSPYTITGTATQAPYTVTGNATVTLTSPTVTLVRDMWQVPAKDADMPPFLFVSTWVEEAYQGNVNGATTGQWSPQPISGILARLVTYFIDGSTNQGPTGTVIGSGSNALQITYDADVPKISESYQDAVTRQRNFYGFDLPQGVFIYDFLNRDLTMQDVMDTSRLGNIKVKFNFASALGSSGSSAKAIRQIISPIEVK